MFMLVGRHTPLWPAGHLPRTVGDWQPQRRPFSCNTGDWRNQSGRLIFPLEGEMAERPEGGANGRVATGAHP